MMRIIRSIAFAMLFLPTAALAQAQDARLSARLDARTAEAVNKVILSARDRGLPTEPLVQKALQGASKNAPGDRIVQAVETLARHLDDATRELEGASYLDVVSAATALEAGATPSSLARLRAKRSDDAPLAPACLTLAFLVGKGVQPDRAADLLGDMLAARARDTDFMTLQRLVEQDVRAGAPPLEAARVRVQGLVVAPVRRVP